MVKSRAIVKNCPKCESRVAVATKSCKCGYAFFKARRSERIREAVEEVDERRRTSRVRREKPNYYDSQQFEKKKKKKETKVGRHTTKHNTMAYIPRNQLIHSLFYCFRIRFLGVLPIVHGICIYNRQSFQ